MTRTRSTILMGQSGMRKRWKFLILVESFHGAGVKEKLGPSSPLNFWQYDSNFIIVPSFRPARRPLSLLRWSIPPKQIAKGHPESTSLMRIHAYEYTRALVWGGGPKGRVSSEP